MTLRSIEGVPKSNVSTADPAYDAAEAAFLRDDLASCRILLGLCRAGDATQRARIALLSARVERLSGNLEAWHSSAVGATGDTVVPTIRLSGLALAAVAARRLGKEAEAARRFSLLDAELRRADADAGAYPRYLLALEAWVERDYDRAKLLAREALIFRPHDCDSLALLGWVEEKRERYSRASALFRKAFAIVRRANPTPVRHQAILLRAILGHAAESADLATCVRFSKFYSAIAWSADMRIIQFNVLSNMRAAALLAGDMESAWFMARSCTEIFTSGPYRLMAEVAFAASTLTIGDGLAATLQFGKAREIMRSIPWSEAAAEERIALLDFAAEASAFSPSDARRALMLYLSIREKKDPTHSLFDDRRVRASEFVAAGRVSEILGERAQALGNYEAAHVIWRELGIVSRAAETSLRLLRMTRDPKYKASIDELALRAPDSSIVREARTWAGPIGTLGPIQQRVLAAILRGDGAKAIAQDFGRSEFTIINHTRRIFAAFAVRSRADLRRACADAGITFDVLTRNCERLIDRTQRESSVRVRSASRR